MSDRHPQTGSLSPDLEEALREAGIDPDSELPEFDPVPICHASGPSEHQRAIDAEIKRQWREWRQHNPDHYDDYALLETLKAEYATVKQVFDALGDDIRDESGWPVYPELVSDFMQSLSRPPRGRPDYQPDRMMAIEANIATASIEDIQHLLTAYGRAERFSDGAWITCLKENRLDAVIKRIEALMLTGGAG